MTPRVLLSLFVLVTLAPRQQPSVPPRDAAPRAPGTASIAGTIVSTGPDPTPVRHARVTLTSADAPTSLTVVTGNDGRFTFPNLPPGRFMVAASKDGWLPSSYGAKAPLRPGTPIPVAPGQTIEIALPLMHGAAVAGEVLDPFGYPAAGATIRAMRSSVVNGERRFTVFGSAATADDRGAYRIYGLPPGEYVVGASWRPSYIAAGSELHLTSEADVRDALRSTDPPRPAAARPHSIALAPTFYPGTSVPRDAATLTIGAGQERTGVDFTLQIVATSRIDGIVSLAGATTLSGALVALMAIDHVPVPGTPLEAYRSTAVQANGSFAFADVPPGRYTVFARATAATGNAAVQPHWASVDISVDDDLSGLNLALAPGLTVSGGVRFDSARLPAPDLKTIRLTLTPIQASSATMSPAPTSLDASGRFSFSGVLPGRYRLSASFPGLGAIGGWAPHSALVNATDILDLPLIILSSDVTGASVTFSDHLAQLTGTLLNTGGAPAANYTLILFPSSSSFWLPQARRIQAIRPAADGAFAFRNLPPGDYLLSAVDDVENGAWFDPSFLQTLTPAAMKLTIADGEQRVQDVRIDAR